MSDLSSFVLCSRSPYVSKFARRTVLVPAAASHGSCYVVCVSAGVEHVYVFRLAASVHERSKPAAPHVSSLGA